MTDRNVEKKLWNRANRGKGRSRDEQITAFRSEFGNDEQIDWKSLTERQRAVLGLWLKGETFTRICTVLALSRQTVTTARKEAIESLRKQP